LRVFAEEVFAPLARSDQRAKAELYVRGLLADGRRKSMLTMAEQLGVDHQGLQQFMTSSTWSVAAVRAQLALRAQDTVRPLVWALGSTGFLKDGGESACVARQHVKGSDRPVNCQVAVTVHMVGAKTSAVVDWGLFVPAEWDDRQWDHLAGDGTADTGAAAVVGRRRRCRVPDNQRHRPQWSMAVEMLDELAGWGLRPPLVLAGPGFGDARGFRAAMDARSLPYLTHAEGRIIPAGPGREVQPVVFSRLLPLDMAGDRSWPAVVEERIARDFALLRQRFGLDHFEGRTWIGWNRHVTLASAAYLYHTESRADATRWWSRSPVE
jgi:SRSO17 transposase